NVYIIIFYSRRRRHTSFSRDWSSDVCSSDLPRNDVRLTDVVQQRRLTVVYVTHHRDDRRPGQQILRPVLGDLLLHLGDVLLLTHRLIAELVHQQFDLVEVEPLVDGDHQPEVLEGGGDDLRGRHVNQFGDLRHGQELVDPDSRRLLLADALALLLASLLRGRTLVAAATTAASTASALHRGHGLPEHLVDRLLVDATTLLAILLPAAAAITRRIRVGSRTRCLLAACRDRRTARSPRRRRRATGAGTGRTWRTLRTRSDGCGRLFTS